MFQNDVYSTANMVATYLKNIGFNKKVFLSGTNGIKEELEEAGIPFIGFGVGHKMLML